MGENKPAPRRPWSKPIRGSDNPDPNRNPGRVSGWLRKMRIGKRTKAGQMADKVLLCTCRCGCRNDCAPFLIPLCAACSISGDCERISKERGYQNAGGH